MITDALPSLRAADYTSGEIANCRIVESWFANMTAGRVAAAFAVVADDVHWATPRAGDPLRVLSKARLVEITGGIVAQSKAGAFPIRPVHMIAKGEIVCVRAESRVPLKNGSFYENEYAFWFEVHDGLIVGAAEYVDTHHVKDIFKGSV